MLLSDPTLAELRGERKSRTPSFGEVSLALSFLDLALLFACYQAAPGAPLALAGAAVVLNLFALVLSGLAMRRDAARQLPPVALVLASAFLFLELFCVYGFFTCGDL